VKVKIRVESTPTTDTWWRYHGLAVDQPLNEDFWISQPEKVIGVSPPQPFTYEAELDLAPGKHTVEYATSGYVPDYAWHAKIYVNDKLVAEGDVGRAKENHLKAEFTVEGPTMPSMEWMLILIAGVAGAILLGGIIAYNELVVKHVG
jgi:hypothetical protein